jgi:6-pyruvoyltetrahydropterin/6-carboxytetrahydropterin synthase
VSADSPAIHPSAITASQSVPKFRLGIRDSFMIAHSFHNNPSFGPAGGLHGATYTCDVEFLSNELHPTLNWVIDIGDASSILSQVLQRYNYRNLDEMFGDNIMTTTEFLCRQIHNDLCELLKQQKVSFCSGAEICVKLWESHKAWASYSATIT